MLGIEVSEPHSSYNLDSDLQELADALDWLIDHGDENARKWASRQYRRLLFDHASGSRTDALTDLPNFRGLHFLFQRVANELVANDIFLPKRRNNITALIVISIDIARFKEINKTLGFSGANGVLVDLARLMQSIFKRTDIVGRLGGDEFLCLIPVGVLDLRSGLRMLTEQELADKLVERLLGACEEYSAQSGFTLGLHAKTLIVRNHEFMNLRGGKKPLTFTDVLQAADPKFKERYGSQ